MTFIQRHLFSILIGIVLAVVLIQLLNLGNGIKAQASSHIQGNPQTQDASPNCNPCYSFYGSVLSWMSTATGDWYQLQPTWCGVASVRAIQRYDWIYYNGGSPGW